MYKRLSIFLLLISTMAMFSTSVTADDYDYTGMLARITLKLNHYPSDAEKMKLKDVINNGATSANQKIIAQAMVNLKHSATDADKSKLKTIMDNASAAGNERKLATILYSIKHKPSAADKKILVKMINSATSHKSKRPW